MDGTIEGFIQWCREELEVAQKSLAFFASGKMHFHVNNVDTSESVMIHLRRVIDDMKQIITKHESNEAS